MYEIDDLEFVEVHKRFSGRFFCETPFGKYIYSSYSGLLFFDPHNEKEKSHSWKASIIEFKQIAQAHWRGILEPFLREIK